MLKSDGGGGKSAKKKKPAKKTPPKTTKTIAKATARTRTTGGKGYKGTTKGTLTTKKVASEAKKYVPSAKAVKSAAKSVPSTAKSGLAALLPDWGLPGGGKNTGDWLGAEKNMDKIAPSIQKTAAKVNRRKKKAQGK